MYGGRTVMIFRTNRFIRAGEEITIDYGAQYFDADSPCACNAFDYPHTSEEYRRRVHPDGSVSPTGVGTYGDMRGQRGGGGSPAPSSGSGSGAEAGGSGARKARTGKGKEKARVRKENVEKSGVRKVRLRVSETRLSSIKRASASRSRRRRSWGSMAYKGGDPDRDPLRRSARIAARGVGA